MNSMIAHRGKPMPKVPMYKLSWLSATETYELYQTRDRAKLGIDPGSPEWFTWLEQVSSFAFSGKSGHYTARKEARQRGDCYWSAYLATGERPGKKYLGKTARLSLSRLEHIAEMLRAQSGTHTSPSVTLAKDAGGEVDTTQGPVLVRLPHTFH